MPDLEGALQAVDDRFRRAQREARIPGVAWGVVRDGELVHSGGSGTIRAGEATVPDAASIFRIASMTKSFTAAAVVLLRDEGVLRLDDPAARFVPSLAAWRGPTADSPGITIRQLLTMSAGLATDDPWGDRQQALPIEAFDQMLEAEPTFAWPPGTAFEYSNLGYAILGRVVAAAAGMGYDAFVRERLLVPLGMASTSFHAADLPAERVVHGYQRTDDELVREGTDGYGAFASMGGLYSSVQDLARWVAGFLDAFPARNDPEGDHPLRRSSRREMQQIQRSLPAHIEGHPVHEAPMPETSGYGLGLFTVSDASGTRTGHGGGYPGFGSRMVWHPATGLGVIALGNLRYAAVRDPADEALVGLVRAEAAPRRAPRRLAAVDGFRPPVERLLARWDDALADRIFAMNMDLDEPRDRRRAAVERIARDHGPFRDAPGRPVVSDSPAHLAWWLRGDAASVRVGILASPEPNARVQALTLTVVPDPSPELVRLAERLLALAATQAPAWPADLVATPAVGIGAIIRSLRAGAARFGPMRLGLPTAGDGVATASFEVHAAESTGGDRGVRVPATISVAVDPETGSVTAAAVRVTDREAPVEDW